MGEFVLMRFLSLGFLYFSFFRVGWHNWSVGVRSSCRQGVGSTSKRKITGTVHVLHSICQLQPHSWYNNKPCTKPTPLYKLYNGTMLTMLLVVLIKHKTQSSHTAVNYSSASTQTHCLQKPNGYIGFALLSPDWRKLAHSQPIDRLQATMQDFPFKPQNYNQTQKLPQASWFFNFTINEITARVSQL